MEKGGNAELCRASLAGWSMATLGTYTFQVSTGLAGIGVSCIVIVYIKVDYLIHLSLVSLHADVLAILTFSETSIIVSIVLYQDSMHSIGYG